MIERRRLIPYVDIAYQGFGDGIDADAFALRALADAGVSFFCASSFSKSFSLYGERCGALSVACMKAYTIVGPTNLKPRRLRALAIAVDSGVVAGTSANDGRRRRRRGGAHAPRSAAGVRRTPAWRADWETELDAMRQRIAAMRERLHAVLSGRLPGRDFGYFLTQRGMFSYTGLSAAQVDRLREEHAVYLVRSGRMCVAGLNSSNVEATAEAMAAVL